MKTFAKLSLLAVATVALTSLTAQATITVTHQYLFEEGGASAGNPITGPLDDSVGSSDMSLQINGALYSANVPAGNTLSTLSGNFAGNGRYDTANGSLWGTALDNFGIELWVRPSTTSGNQPIAINGFNAGIQAIYQIGGEYHMMLDNVMYDFNASITGVGTWDHVAMVRDSGVATLYVNGVAIGNTSATVVNAPNAHSFIGATSWAPTTGQFLGMVDTVRYFTFTGGAFQVGDLDFPSAVPEPSTILLLAVGGAIAYRKSRRA